MENDTAHPVLHHPEDPGYEEQISYQLPYPPHSAQKQAIEILDENAAYNAIEANATYVGNRTPPFAAAQSFVEIERTRPGMSLLATDLRSEAHSTINDRSIHQVIKTPPDCLDQCLATP